MGSKKRKESSGAADEPSKKTKKSKTTEKKNVTTPESSENLTTADKTSTVSAVPQPEPTLSDNAVPVKSKKSRKRAVDFMDEGAAAADSDGGVEIKENTSVNTAEEPAKKKAKKKSKKSKDGESLTADGINGVIEHTGTEELETATTHKPVSTSMQAEAERTVDNELENGFGGFASEDDKDDVAEVEVDDNAAALLAGFDSDNEDGQQDEGLDLSKIPALPKSKKLQKKLDKAKAKADNEGPGSLYVGRIPHGFYEKQMREYFSQFGDITKLRLARNKRSGASKHYAFIEFGSDSVAKIAAEAMDNYLMFGHILKCKYAEVGSLHPDVWKGANKKFRKIPHEKLDRERLAAPKTEEKWQKKVEKETRKRDKKAEKMKAIGLDMPASTLTNPSTVLMQKLADQDKPQAIEEVAPAAMIEPPKDVPTDEVAATEGKKEKKEKKERKAKKVKKGESELISNEEDAAPAAMIEPPKDIPRDEVAAPEGKKAKKEKKAKKAKKGESETVSDEKPAEEPETKDAKDEPEKPDVEEQLPKVDTETSTKKKKKTKDEKKASKAKKSVNNTTDDLEAPVADEVVEDKPEEPAVESPPEAQADVSADFISLGQFDEDKLKQSPKAGAKTLKPWKVKKPKKDRKNLVKARGPKSKLVATKPKPDTNAPGKIPGLALMGKGKYDKATRQAYKEQKKKVVAERMAKGLPAHRVRGETS